MMIPTTAAAAANTEVIIHMPSRNAARSDWRCPSSITSNPSDACCLTLASTYPSVAVAIGAVPFPLADNPTLVVLFRVCKGSGVPDERARLRSAHLRPGSEIVVTEPFAFHTLGEGGHLVDGVEVADVVAGGELGYVAA